MITKGLMSSNSDEWGTPQSTFEYLHKIFKFNLDCCASELNHKLDNYYSLEDNALEQDWNGVVWCNPPYSKGLQTKFIDKAIKETTSDKSKCQTVVMLIPARTDTRNFERIVCYANQIIFIKGRISFLKGDGSKSQSSPFPSMIVILSKDCNTHLDMPSKDYNRFILVNNIPRKD